MVSSAKKAPARVALSSSEQLNICKLPYNLNAEKQSSSRLCLSEDQTEMTAPLLSHHDPSSREQPSKLESRVLG